MSADQQKKINSGFGAKSEPSEVLEGKDLTGKVAIVTGGYSGIGLETTRALCAAGAKVYVPVRTPAKAKENLADIEGEVIVDAMDLADLPSVEAYVKSIADRESSIDILINNAGIMACPESRIGNNWESQFAVNHLGHFVLTTGLLPQLIAEGGARVVCLSSTAHRRSDVLWDDIHFLNQPYEKWTAYAQAKTANALFALGLDTKYGDQGVKAFSVHPGGILTPLQRHLPVEEMVALGWTDAEGNISEQAAAMFKTTTQGCTTSLWAATSESLADLGGLYCEDCDVADLAGEDSPSFFGVSPWAVNEDSAQKLWSMTEEMLSL
ncbi:MAG: SDR family NAD(P)-dependent oxidoreductase [Gammaproteobacteria bacterium]|jgi:NAD(P)-dependent dehydrogenase (short-subunit alcohol dehydrogenase family)|nr:SDR family NAD(P)-dependent oxidoreductase [Gammaproteobacteria bacterium]MBT3860643.1 SDR family NAD(P)-dependent oxidoreductase [Gammaproteobacteria bacterium]MBT3988780.1 SDR family NAD(P)-dependent oxidoreductase [Gammaproteobacteria bacterium]MBT4254909.1 SDR family NAD(P)-dependent oxidoreductase [Gammaproteobacteria bacterium]MBT4582643.1 SDR family NAD(P)-dependent oxidoreductase [Gammaproteobacteria bacterium]